MPTLQTLRRPEAVVFDFDGVIVDTEPLHFAAFREILEPLGIRFAWEEYVGTYMGFDDRDAFREAFRRHGRALSEGSLPDLIDGKSRRFQGLLRGELTAYPGAVALIESLHASGTPLAICSGALRADIDPILDRLRIAHCFLHVVAADDVRRGKPDPEGYVLAFRRLSLSRSAALTGPGRCLAVEDTPAGIEAARRTGLSVLAVTNSYPAEALSDADAVTDSLARIRWAD